MIQTHTAESMGYYVFLRKIDRMNLRALILLLTTLLTLACEQKSTDKTRAQVYIDSLKSEVAPDKRVALFAIEALENEGKLVLKGESDQPEGVRTLTKVLENNNIVFIDSISMLPAMELGENIQAIINISVANLRSNPKHSAELATQATLGTPVKVLKKEGDWYYIQTPDKYLSWVDEGGITLMDSVRFQQWKTQDKIIYTKTYGHAYFASNLETRVSDLVAGSMLEVLSDAEMFYKVRFPDGREAYVEKVEAKEYDVWLESLNPNADTLVETSKTLMGVPYLWGGTSTKGMDCSGFTKTIYFLNGMVIPRDASQQVHAGKQVDSVQNFENLERGDLLFFGRKATDSTAEKVVHVGMWIGNNEFIHASEMVRVSSMDPAAKNFDEANKNRYLRTKRILKEKGEELINLTQTPLFKD